MQGLRKRRKAFFKIPVQKRRRFAAHRWSYSKKRPQRKKRLGVIAIKKRISKIKGINKPRFGTLFIKKMRRNTFLNISRRLKNKAIDKYGKKSKKAYWCLTHAVSIGHLRTFKGRAKSSTIALRALANV